MIVEEVQETFGDYLIKERESRNITAEELAKTTHLSIHFIEALEHNDFALISQKESIPGFLKLYAKHLPLDYEGVLKRYQREDERILKQRVHQEMPFSRDYSPPLAQTTKTQWLAGHFGKWVIPAACTAMAVVIALYVYLSPEKTQLPAVPSSASSSSTARNIQHPQSVPIQPIVSETSPQSSSTSLPANTSPTREGDITTRSNPTSEPSSILKKSP